MTYYRDDNGSRLPIKIDSTSNGEFAPRPLTELAQHANNIAHEQATDCAKRLGMSRRRFLVTACGAAASLLAINRAYAGANPAGTYHIDAAARLEPEAALEALGGREFIFDVQTHHVNPAGPWRTPLNPFNIALRAFPQARCGDSFLDRVFGSIDCFSARHFIKEVFLDSDTDMAVLSFVPSRKDAMPLTLQEGDETRQIIDSMEGSHRLLLHGPINPRIAGELELMPELVEDWPIAAWKTYTQWGPDGVGYWLDDPRLGIPFIERARTIGPKRICIHKGLPFPDQQYEYSLCRDVGVVAKLFPDVDFIIYHSGYEPGVTEGPYDPSAAHRGIDSLVESLLVNEVAPNSNVYAEIGSSWRFLMRNPNEAAHALGKLFKHVGEDRVLWGTDSIWYGSPQDQIQAFRSFRISDELQDKYSYPNLTPQLRAKVFGLNAVSVYDISLNEVQRRADGDVIERLRQRYQPEQEPSFLTYGPKTRRQFLRFLRWQRDTPA